MISYKLFLLFFVSKSQCTFKLGEKEFTYNFIVCKHLLRPMIIGVDFLKQKQIFV